MKSVATAENTLSGEIDERRQHPDRRSSSRRKFLKIGQMFWPNGDFYECIVLNLSEKGAKLEIRGPLPKQFDLVVDGHQWRRSCTLVWRKANQVGVKFKGRTLLVASRPAEGTDGFRGYVDACRMLATRTAAQSDRELLLEMAEAWTAIIRRLRRLQRNQSSAGTL